jgi:eukaryotic-like serine/threonine-protein kinase
MTVIQRLSAALQDRYTIERELGRGGMATVFLARDLKHGRSVAIKVMDPQVGSALGSDRFLLEIRTAARLNHPNILSVFDSGEADGLLYYVMPRVEGESLRGRLDRDGPLPIADALRIACQVADALECAHQHHVVHRDIKPENILFANPSHAYVTDFGIVKALQDTAAARLTNTGAIVGSPYYLSPEQATADELVDGRSDIYSLGCVLYEMLSGRPPFAAGNSAALLAGHLAVEPRPLRELRAGVPAAVESIVARALSKSPQDRQQSADALKADLEDAIGSETRGASDPKAPPRAPKRADPSGGSRHHRGGWPFRAQLVPVAVRGPGQRGRSAADPDPVDVR